MSVSCTLWGYIINRKYVCYLSNSKIIISQQFAVGWVRTLLSFFKNSWYRRIRWKPSLYHIEIRFALHWFLLGLLLIFFFLKKKLLSIKTRLIWKSFNSFASKITWLTWKWYEFLLVITRVVFKTMPNIYDGAFWENS